MLSLVCTCIVVSHQAFCSFLLGESSRKEKKKSDMEGCADNESVIAIIFDTVKLIQEMVVIYRSSCSWITFKMLSVHSYGIDFQYVVNLITKPLHCEGRVTGRRRKLVCANLRENVCGFPLF